MSCLEEQNAAVFKVKMTTGMVSNYWNRFNISEAIFKIMWPHLTGIKFWFHKTEGQIYVKRERERKTVSSCCIICSSGTNQPLTIPVHRITILYHTFSPLTYLNPLNPELNPICYLLALLGAHHFLHISRIRVKLLTFRLLKSYIYGAPILDVSRSHTTMQHSR